jgi:pyruvate,water dikinase
MDIEWAQDGADGPLYILQARPETVQANVAQDTIAQFKLTGTAPVLTSGRAVGTAIAAGKAQIIDATDQLGSFEKGNVLVARSTTPDWEPILANACAVVTDHGGRTCHAAIVARELGVPAIVGTGDATQQIVSGDTITVSCAQGEVGRVYSGEVAFEVEQFAIGDVARPMTKIMVNVGNPAMAFQTCRLPNDGVGLARIEFIITEHIGVHPMALLHPERVTNADELQQIKGIIRHHDDGASYFVRQLSEGVATIAAAFYPKPVTVRLSDFKTNEYATLLGGAAFEQPESNPMIGFRGAARYAHPAYSEAFALECAALARVRGEMGFDNVRIMVPFCRTLGEADETLAAMRNNGLARGENGLEIWIMCEIPSNVFSIEDFAERFDGFSIGSNDLTQLVLGIDRDSDILAPSFDERDPAVLAAIKMAIDGAHKAGRPIGICGQAPSDHPEFAAFLVQCKIDSISLSADSVLAAIERVNAAERATDAIDE